MIVTGAFFADRIETVDNKANITGGVQDYITLAGSGDVWNTNLVLLLQSNPDDAGKDHTATIEIFDPNYESVHKSDSTIQSTLHRGENRFWFFVMPLTFAIPGRYAFVVTVEGSTVSVPITVFFE